MNCLFRFCCHIHDDPESPKIDIIDSKGKPVQSSTKRFVPQSMSKITAIEFIIETSTSKEINKAVIRKSLDNEQKKKAESLFDKMVKEGI